MKYCDTVTLYCKTIFVSALTSTTTTTTPRTATITPTAVAAAVTSLDFMKSICCLEHDHCTKMTGPKYTLDSRPVPV